MNVLTKKIQKSIIIK